MKEPIQHEEGFRLGLNRKSLEAKIICACQHCQAPGVYSAHESIQQGWPGCYDPENAQRPVGDICPNCGNSRNPDVDLGELQSSIPLWLWNTITRLRSFIAKTLQVKRKVIG